MSKKQESFAIPEEEEDYEEYFGSYGSFADESLGGSSYYDKRIFSFMLKIDRVFQLIYQYRDNMDDWEIEFYLGYLMDEIDFSTWSLSLLKNCIYENKLDIIKVLKLDSWIHQSQIGLGLHDISNILYKVYGDPFYREEQE